MKYLNRKVKTILLSGLLSMGIVATSYMAFNKQVVLIVDGQEIEVNSMQPNVQGVLDENNIDYDKNYKISEDLGASLEDGMKIEVKKVEEKEEKATQEIDFETVVQNDNTLEKGKTKVVQEGQMGAKELIYKAIYHDGSLVSRELVKENVVKEPQNKIIAKGTKENVQAVSTSASTSSSSNAKSSKGRHMTVSATAYSGDGITATGTVPRWGTIAVDPSVIPYGTKVYIPQFDQYFIAEDCGGAIKGNKIDIFMNSESQCINWGRRTIDIYIVG